MAQKILDPMAEEMARKIKKGISIVVIVLLALIIISSSFYTVGETESVVITTFGKASLVDEK